jgi:hypothetical protein
MVPVIFFIWSEYGGVFMGYAERAHGPFGLDAQRGQTVHYQRTVLVVVHTVTAGTRLADVAPLLETDLRVQVVFTYAPSALISGGVREYLDRLGGIVLSWQLATQLRFDLALAASDGLLEWVHGPVMRMPHGIGYTKYPARWDGDGMATHRAAAGPEPARLITHGRTIASAIVLPTQSQVERLRRSCPEAASIAVVAGDLCYDRLAASMPDRHAYRRALSVGDRKLVAVSSTWGPGSLLRHRPGLLAELLDALPSHRYQLAAIIHPGVWDWHGSRQVRSWYAECVRRGLILIPPEEGWRAVLTAADVMIGDHGSVTTYAAAAGIPVLLASRADDEVEPGSPAAIMGEIAPALRPGEPLAAQIELAAAAWPPERHAQIRTLVTDIPGQSAAAMRSAMYRLIRLPEPASPARTQPVPVPQPAGPIWGQ